MFKRNKKEVKSQESLLAEIVISELIYNNSVVTVDENGEGHTPPIPDPLEEKFIVKQGDRVHGFEVLEVLTNFLVLKSFAEYTTGNDPAPKTQFIIGKGECINLTMYGVRDAVNKISIKYIGE